MVRIYIRMLRNPFKWVEFALEYVEFGLNGETLHSKASNHFRMVRIYIQMPQITFEWLEFGYECFKSLSNG